MSSTSLTILLPDRAPVTVNGDRADLVRMVLELPEDSHRLCAMVTKLLERAELILSIDKATVILEFNCAGDSIRRKLTLHE